MRGRGPKPTPPPHSLHSFGMDGVGGGVWCIPETPRKTPGNHTAWTTKRGNNPLQGVRGGQEIKSNNFIWTNQDIIKGLIKINYVVVAPVWEVWPCSVLLAGRHEGSWPSPTIPPLATATEIRPIIMHNSAVGVVGVIPEGGGGAPGEGGGRG